MNIGATIRAFDFNPAAVAGAEYYVEGVVSRVVDTLDGNMFVIAIPTVDTLYPETPRKEVFVPEKMYHDFAGRIQVIV